MDQVTFSMPGAPEGLAPRRSRLRDETRQLLISLGIVGATLAVVLFAMLRSPMKDDVAWLLWVARQWLAGKALYIDVVEINPPLIIWLSALPVMVADMLGVSAKVVALPLIAAGALGSAWSSARLLHGVAPVFARRSAVFSAIAVVLLVMPGVEFGQREHLLIIAVLPNLCLLVRMLEGQPVGLGSVLGTGIVAGLGCALKPRYLLGLAVVELAAWLHRGFRLRLSPVVAFGAAGLYALSILMFFPAFIERAVPLALTLYGGTDTGMLQLAQESWLLLLGLGVCALLTWQTPRDRPGFSVMLVLTAFAAAATLVMFLDGKNWFYHRIPAMVTAVLALVFWCSDAALGRLADGRGEGRRMALMALAVVPLALYAAKTSDRMYERLVLAVEPDLTTEVRLEKLIRRENVRSYVAFSEWIGLGFPVINDTNVTWASRFDSMWALRGELWRARMDGKAPAEWPIRRWVVQDFMQGCPDLVVVDRRGEAMNYPAILAQADAGFADVWALYRQIAVVDGLQVYRRQSEDCREPSGG
jgi:hypothetical protein